MSNCPMSKRELLSIINHEEEEHFRWEEDMKCVAENPTNYLQQAIQEDEKKSLFEMIEILHF